MAQLDGGFESDHAGQTLQGVHRAKHLVHQQALGAHFGFVVELQQAPLGQRQQLVGLFQKILEEWRVVHALGRGVLQQVLYDP